MARPAGYSSDEAFSDDEFYLSTGETLKKRYIHQDKVFDPAFENEERLISSVINGEFEEVKKYVESKININYKSAKYGNWTALMHACSLGDYNIIKYLLENKASTQEHHELITPLLCLCDSKNRNENNLIECLELLIDYEADVNATDWFKTNALVYAIRQRREKLVLKLLDVGCDKECSDSDGWTPVFYAVDGGCLQIVQILKDAGANIKKIDNRGKTLFDIAQAKHHKEIAEIVNTVEKHDDIDDIIDNSKEYKRLSNFELVLSDLPDRSKGRLWGFHRDAIRWIYGIGLGSLVKLLLKKNVQLNQLLTMDEEDLKTLGIELSYDRKKLRYCVQKLHEYSWGKNCLKVPSNEEEISLNMAAELLCDVIQQVHICSASTYFWRKYSDQQLSANEKAYIEKGMYYIKFMQKEMDTILRIVKEVEESDKIVPSDLILPQRTKKYSTLKIILSITFSLLIFKTLQPNLMSLRSRII